MHSYSDLSVLTTPSGSDAMDVELQETAGEQKSWYYYESAKMSVRLLIIIGLFMCTTDRNIIIIIFLCV